MYIMNWGVTSCTFLRSSSIWLTLHIFSNRDMARQLRDLLLSFKRDSISEVFCNYICLPGFCMSLFKIFKAENLLMEFVDSRNICRIWMVPYRSLLAMKFNSQRDLQASRATMSFDLWDIFSRKSTRPFDITEVPHPLHFWWVSP